MIQARIWYNIDGNNQITWLSEDRGTGILRSKRSHPGGYSMLHNTYFQGTSWIPKVNYTKYSNIVLDYFLPHIGQTAYTIYCLYCRLVNADLGYAYPTLDTIAKHLQIRKSEVTQANKVLVKYQLVAIVKGCAHISNRYYILRPSKSVLADILFNEKKEGMKPLVVCLDGFQ